MLFLTTGRCTLVISPWSSKFPREQAAGLSRLHVEDHHGDQRRVCSYQPETKLKSSQWKTYRLQNWRRSIRSGAPGTYSMSSSWWCTVNLSPRGRLSGHRQFCNILRCLKSHKWCLKCFHNGTYKGVFQVLQEHWKQRHKRLT